MWAWLADNHKQIGAVGSILFGLASAAIAFMAYVLNYRNIRGMKPLLIFNAYAYGSDAKNAILSIDLMFWNRRNYPVVLRRARFKCDMVVGLKTGRATKGGADLWRWRTEEGGGLIWEAQETVEANSSRHFRIRVPVILDPHAKTFEPHIELRYLDLLRGRYLSIWGRYIEDKLYRSGLVESAARWKKRLFGREASGRSPPWLRPPRT